MDYNDNDICIKMAKMEVKIDTIETNVTEIKNNLKAQNKKFDAILEMKADKAFVWRVFALIGGIATILIAILSYIK